MIFANDSGKTQNSDDGTDKSCSTKRRNSHRSTQTQFNTIGKRTEAAALHTRGLHNPVLVRFGGVAMPFAVRQPLHHLLSLSHSLSAQMARVGEPANVGSYGQMPQIKINNALDPMAESCRIRRSRYRFLLEAWRSTGLGLRVGRTALASAGWKPWTGVSLNGWDRS